METLPLLTRLIDQIAAGGQLAIERAVASRFFIGGAQPAADPDPLEKAADRLLDILPDDKLQALKAAVTRSLAASPRERRRRLGVAADVDLTSEESISAQIRKAPFDRRLSDDPRRPLGISVMQARRPSNMLAAELASLMHPTQRSADALTYAPAEQFRDPRPPQFFMAHVAGFVGPAAAASGGVSHGSTLIGTGALQTKYIQMGGQNSVLGDKIGAERIDQDWSGRLGRVQVYENGMCWTDGVNAFCIWGSIYDHWRNLDGLSVPHLGFPAMDQRRAPRDDGWFCHFHGTPQHGMGSIYHGDLEPACEIHGAIRSEYASHGWEFGNGWLLTDEVPNGEPPFGQSGASSEARLGKMWWSPPYGAHSLPAQVNTLYEQFGGPSGNLGHISWTASDLNIRPVNFEGGRFTITGNPAQPVLDDTPRAHAFRLITVKANKTTKEPGLDEIKLSVARIDPDGEVRGELINLGQFNNGTVAAPNLFTTFNHDPNRSPPLTWPRFVAASYFLVEADDGDLDAWHLSLIENIKDTVESELESGLEGLGIALGGLGKAIAIVLELGLGTILDKIFGDIKDSLTEDTIFPAVVVSRTLASVWSGPPSQAVDEGWHVLGVDTRLAKAGGGEYELRVSFLRSVDPA
ncbi:hypothetical protein KUW17_22595 [Leisingera aquaemixtae]|uniref:LGFP repeat-containing protein n=1 Tax=Leisingera aquaemixtae TaxID=1396826 RepID=UPI001C93780B|nr:hypothetical protein [Leisingera aquaemixtae]MBY6069543.1 hypothetical protein [Leisingera aquaemixtae]